MTPIPVKEDLPETYLPQGAYDLSKNIFYSYDADWVFFRNEISVVDLSQGTQTPEAKMTVVGHPDWLIYASFDVFVSDSN
jgi:hypothetical protein